MSPAESGGAYEMMVKDKPVCPDGDDACKIFHMQMDMYSGPNVGTFLFD